MFIPQANYARFQYVQCPIPDETNCPCGDVGLLPSSYLNPTNLNYNGPLFDCPIRVLQPNLEPLFKSQKRKNVCKK
jgi:hypothetical protein